MKLLKFLLPFVFAGSLFASDFTVKDWTDSTKANFKPRKAIYKDDKMVDLAYGDPSFDAMNTLLEENKEIFSKNFSIIKKYPEKLVVVPDLESFVFEISKWNKDKKWPVFIDGNKYLDQFIEAYEPSSIDTVKSLRNGFKVDEDFVYTSLAASQMDGHALQLHTGTKDDYRGLCDNKGIVLTKLNDDCFPGALALAAYYGQWLDFMGNFMVKHDANIGSFVAGKLQDRVLEKVKGFNYEGLGNLDYLTLGLDFAYKYKGKWEFGDAFYALDNLLARDKDGSKWAYHGRLIDRFNGDFVGGGALFQAMSGLFLEPSKCLMFDTYWDMWDGYKADLAYDKLKDVMDVTLVQRPESSPDRWKSLMDKKNLYDILFVQSRGTPENFNSGLTEGMSITGDSTSYFINFKDIPKSVPSIVLFTHSYSAANPYDASTIAGRFIKNGAFAYYGAVSEPFVYSFNQPGHVVNNMLLGKSLGEATQDRSLAIGNDYSDSKKDGTKSWRNIFVGNPRKVWNVRGELK